MKLARIALAGVLVLGGASCGGARTSTPSSPAAVAPGFPATRWVPASPSYVLAAPTFAHAQRSVRDALDGLGMFVGLSVESAGSELARLLGVNPLDPDAVSAIGIDLEGGIVAFSEDLAPTFVARIAAPEQMQAFLDKQRERGMVSRSVIVEGVEVYTAELIRGELDVSWAIADGWMWLHFTPSFARNEGTAWFSNSRRPASTDWARDWSWAQAAAGATNGLVGFLDPKDILGRIAAQAPSALACVRLVEPVQRVGISLEAVPGAAKGKLSLDVGSASTSIASATLPVPEGFASATTNAPIVAQWNLDLVALRGWAQPCLAAMRADLGILDRFGIRAGRGIVQRFDPDDKAGEGVVSLDLVHRKFLANLLDDIPMRSTLERDRKFGPLAGHSIAIPFVTTVDYVLTDTLAFAAVGEGVLAKVVGGGKRVPGPVAAVDVLPPALSAEAWSALFEMIDLRRPGDLVERLLRWREGHLSIAIEGTSIVVAASGTRR